MVPKRRAINSDRQPVMRKLTPASLTPVDLPPFLPPGRHCAEDRGALLTCPPRPDPLQPLPEPARPSPQLAPAAPLLSKAGRKVHATTAALCKATGLFLTPVVLVPVSIDRGASPVCSPVPATLLLLQASTPLPLPVCLSFPLVLFQSHLTSAWERAVTADH